jgi:hypothetical protein
MLAIWKPLALAAIGIFTMLWLGPHRDSAKAYSTSDLAMDAPAPRGCVAQRVAGCTVDVRYAYPAAELSVLPDDAFF